MFGMVYLAQFAHAADDATSVCLAMVTDAAHNVSISSGGAAFLNTVFFTYCRSDGTTTQSQVNAGLSAIISEIPVGFTLGSQDAQTSYSNFCKNYASTAAASSSSFSSESKVVADALTSANQCLAIATSGTRLTYKINSMTQMSINFSMGPDTTLNIQSITADQHVTCTGKNLAGNGAITYSQAVGQRLPAHTDNYAVTCQRAPSGTTASGQAQFSEAGITVSTGAGMLDIYWPPDTALALVDANSIAASIQGLFQQLTNVSAVANGAKGSLDSISTNAKSATTTSGSVASNGARTITSTACPAGEYVASIDFGFSGTCGNACNADGAIMYSAKVNCKPLF
jgi:hypothetical protein